MMAVPKLAKPMSQQSCDSDEGFGFTTCMDTLRPTVVKANDNDAITKNIKAAIR